LIQTKLQIEGRARDLAMFFNLATASFVAVMSSPSGSKMSLPAATLRIAQPSDKRKPGSP
jgi:hypothetical protein